MSPSNNYVCFLGNFDTFHSELIPQSDKMHANIQCPSENDPAEFEEKGNEFLRNKQYDQAIRSYSMAMKFDTRKEAPVHIYYSNRSAAYVCKNEGRRALEDAEKCTELSPDWSEGYYRKGAALHLLRRYPDAIAAFKIGLEKAPGDPALTKQLAECRSALEKRAHERAASSYRFQVLENDPRTTLVHESSARQFCKIWHYLISQAFRHMKNDTSFNHIVTWHESNVFGNSPDSNFYGAEYLFCHFSEIYKNSITNATKEDHQLLEHIANEVQSPCHKQGLSSEEVAQVKAWETCCVSAAFWFVGYHDKRVVLVHLDEGEDEDKDAVFLVKGLLTPFSILMEQFPDFSLPGRLFEATLLPWKNLILFNAIRAHHLHSKLHLEAHDRLARALERCQQTGRVFDTLTREVCDRLPMLRKNVDSGDLGITSSMSTISHGFVRTKADETELQGAYTIWHDQEEFNHELPDMNTIMAAPPHVYYPGYKTMLKATCRVNDAEDCPLCASKQPFAQCCKSVHLSRDKKAEEKGREVLYCEDVISMSEVVDSVLFDLRIPEKRLSLFNYHTTTFYLNDANEMNELRHRLTSSECRPMFHTASANFFNFLGYTLYPTKQPCGIKVYGSVELHPASAKVEMTTDSSQRYQILLSEVQRVCDGLHPTDPVVTFSPVSGGIDKQGRKENLSKSVKGIDSFAGAPKVKVDKMPLLAMKCSFCAMKADGKKGVKIKACSACKEAFYCSAECQKKDWKEGGHKLRCQKAMREKTKK